MNYRELRHALRSKLGAEEESGERHHIYFYLTWEDRDYRVAKVSHSARGHDQVDDYIVQDTYKRLKLNRQELEQVVDCVIEAEEFFKLWEERDP